MILRFFLSNISPVWPIERQEALLGPPPPGAVVFRDILDRRDRQSHQPDRLVQRALMLRPTRRKGGVFTLAAWPVLAWTTEDMLACLTLIMERGASLRVLASDMTIEPGSGPAVLLEAMQAFTASRKRDAAVARGMTGGAVSGATRSAEKEATAKRMEPFWRLPNEPPNETEALLKRFEISRNTAKKYLGKRSDAQRVYQSTMKGKATRDRQKTK